MNNSSSSQENEVKPTSENHIAVNLDGQQSLNKEQFNEVPAKAHNNSHLLQSVFNASLNVICVFQAVRDNKDEIVDFRYLITNNSIYPEIQGNNRMGRLYSEVHSEISRKGIFARLKTVVETGERDDFEVYYNQEGLNAWVRLVALKLDDGVVITLENITEEKTAEDAIKTMETVQQHELFKATLDAQEKERRRIAESLHNGLGQILYGAKLTLNDLRLRPGDVWHEKYQQILQDTDRLLTEAINETRRMSHELIPTVLEDFGLKTAIEDICRQFRNVLNITCTFTGLPAKLDQYIEITVYRMIQELVTNIVKHANATEASIYMEAAADINITVKDNGTGFVNQTGKNGGIGLKTIQGNIKMLNGTLTISSAPGGGATISVAIPNKPAGA